jgi:hypothetical protein
MSKALGSVLVLLLTIGSTLVLAATPEKPLGPPARSGGFEAYQRAKQHPQAVVPPDEGREKAPIYPGVSFDAYSFDTNFAEVSNYFIPPDPIGAAGRDRVIAVVNVGIECRDKTGLVIFRDSLRDLFGGVPGALGTFCYDPKIVYDQYEDRFVVLALEQTDVGSGDPSDESRILLAVSKNGVPATATAADWNYFVIDSKTVIGSGPTWADYPGLEVDEEAVYVTANMFPFSSSSGSFSMRLWVVDKGVPGGFYSGGPTSYNVYDPYGATGASGFETTTMPAQVFGAGGVAPGVGTYLLAYSGLTYGGAGNPEALMLIRVDNPLGAIAFTQEFVTIGDIEDIGGGLGFPPIPNAPQAGGSALIDVNDRRLLDAVWRNGFIWACTTINPNASDPANSGQATAHWIQLDATAIISNTVPAGMISLRQEGNAGGEDIDTGMYTFFPSIAVNDLDQMKLGFAGSSPNVFAGAYAAGRIPADPVGTVGPTGVVRAGADYYLRTFGSGVNRWGDYSGISVDPADGTTFWVFNQFAGTRGTPFGGEDGRWGTAWMQCSFTPPAQPDLIVSVLDGPCCAYHGEVVGGSIFCEVRNIGSGAAGPFTVGLYVSSDPTIDLGDDPLVSGTAALAGLAPGTSVVVAFPSAAISAAAPLGDVYLGAIADNGLAQMESDETNNTAGRSIVVNPTVEGCTRAMVSYRAAPQQVSVYSLPNGMGDPLTAAQTFGGGTVDATIDFMAVDCDGVPVPGIRPILYTTAGGLVSCPGDAKADAPTNAAGITKFSGRLYAGGYTNPGSELTLVDGMVGPLAEVLYGDKEMFASDQNGDIARVNLATGVASVVCNLGPNLATEIEYNPLDGRSIAAGGGGTNLIQEFDMFSCSPLAPGLSTASTHSGMEWIGTTLYSANFLVTCGSSTLSRLDPTTGAQANFGLTGYGPISGLAWDACCHILYGVTGCTNTYGLSNLLRIDPNTGAATLIGNTQLQLGSLEFGPNHRLYAGAGQSGAGRLWLLDTDTGAATLVGSTGLPAVTGLALVSDPGMDIQFNSADIDGNLIVNLSDVGTFAIDYNGAYNYRSDFRWDGMINLADVGNLASALGAACPAVIPKQPTDVVMGGEVGVYFDAAGTRRMQNLQPGTSATAYVLARGQAARDGVSAWEYQLTTSSNVKIEKWILDEGGVNVGKDDNVVFGLGHTKQAAKDAPLLLGQVRLQVTDTEPARLDLKASSKPSLPGGHPVVLQDGSLLALDVLALDNGATAVLNDEAVEGSTTPVFTSVDLRNSPNPFNPATEIRFNLPRSGDVEVRVYDASGREVRRLGGARLDAGANSLHWNGTDKNRVGVVSGVYFYRLFLDGKVLGSPVKMTLLK